MGINLPDLIHPRARQGQQRMIDLDPHGTDDIAVVPDHQVIDAVHRAGKAVLDGQDAILAQAALNRPEDILEGSAVQDGGITDHLFTGQLGIGTFDALTGNHGFFGKNRGHSGDDFPDLLPERASRMAVHLLTHPAVIDQQVIERPDALFVFFPSLLRNFVQQTSFPLAVQHGQVVFPLIPADGPGGFHSSSVEFNDLMVYFIDLFSQFTDIHWESPLHGIVEPFYHSAMSGAMTDTEEKQSNRTNCHGSVGRFVLTCKLFFDMMAGHRNTG